MLIVESLIRSLEVPFENVNLTLLEGWHFLRGISKIIVHSVFSVVLALKRVGPIVSR